MNTQWLEMEPCLQRDFNERPQIKILHDQAAGDFEKFAELILSSRDLSVIDSLTYRTMLFDYIDLVKYEYNFEEMLKAVFKDRIKYFDVSDLNCNGFALGNESFNVNISCTPSDDEEIAYLVLDYEEIPSITEYIEWFFKGTRIVGSFNIYLESDERTNLNQRYDEVLATLTGDFHVFECYVNSMTPCQSLVIFLRT